MICQTIKVLAGFPAAIPKARIYLGALLFPNGTNAAGLGVFKGGARNGGLVGLANCPGTESGADSPTFPVSVDPKPVNVAGTGTMSSTGTAVTGAGTAFLSECPAGIFLETANGYRAQVDSVTDNTTLTLKTAFGADVTNVAFTRISEGMGINVSGTGAYALVRFCD